MNYELLINMYNLLQSYIKKNEEDLVTYNNMVTNGASLQDRMEFCKGMKPIVDNFYAIKPYYLQYRDNPTKELEKEIKEKFGTLLGIAAPEVEEESSKKPFPGEDELPDLDDDEEEDFTKFNGSDTEKKSFPMYEPTDTDLEKEAKRIEKLENDEMPDLEDTEDYDFSKFSKKDPSPRKRLFTRSFSSGNKGLINKLKNKFKNAKEKVKSKYDELYGNEENYEPINTERTLKPKYA